jgi:hypothetical protein
MTVPALAGERDQNEAVVVGKLWFRCPYGIAQVAEMLTGDYHRKLAMLTPANASGPSRIDAGRAGATIETVLSWRERQRDLAASWLPSCLHYHLVWWSPNESVEKVTFLKTASSAGSKIKNYHFLS